MLQCNSFSSYSWLVALCFLLYSYPLTLEPLWSNWTPHLLLMGMENGTVAVEGSLVIPLKRKHRFTIQSRNAAPKYVTKINENIRHTKTCTWTITAALFTRAKRWKPPRCPSTSEWIKKSIPLTQWNIIQPYTKNGILTPAMMWMNPEHILLRGKKARHKRPQSV